MFKKIFFICLTALVVSCSSKEEDILPEIPDRPGGDSIEVKDSKPKAMWIAAYDTNYKNLRNDAAVKTYLQKCKSIGINLIYMDAVVSSGYALANIPSLKKSNDVDWDFFESVVTNCDSMGLDLIANITPLCAGNTKKRIGVVYDDSKWDGKTQCKKTMLEGSNYVIVDSRDDSTADAAMLDPSVPEVREYAAKICRELAVAYKDHKCFKGISLDYVRYSNADGAGAWFGYGPVETNFEKETGKVLDSANDFISATGGYGKYYSEWIYFRTNSVTKTIRQIKEQVKSAVPECELHLWASAQWTSRYSVGQNWASNKFIPSPSANYIEGYENTGFAEDLDVFILGAYASDIYITDNPSSDWTVENFVKSYTKYIPKGNPCKVYGSLGVYSYNDANTKFKKTRDATYLCLMNTDGYMAFEIGHVTNIGLWDAIEEGIRLSGY